ncbi:MAG TPA: DmsC/YnfH family molybdoenzyme membrane anchor subunit [Burkholderiales bacterium]|nr:DmsC/YnfH family molybdoenzyme membrane anchor subunit [Burkholderiales bacterium]
MSFGPNPWHQTNWDFRAAFNFIFGGAGAGLLVAAALSGASGNALRGVILIGMALIGAGLISVWFEIGRPLRAMNVGFNPFTSWMTRESFAAGLVFVLGLAAVWLASHPLAQAAAAAALVFAYCQGRILQAAKGIPAWRVPALIWLIFTTGLTEGAGLFVALVALLDMPARGVLAYFSLALIARALAWSIYRGGAAKGVVRTALAVLDRAGKILIQFGTLAPLALLLVAWFAPEVGRIAVALAGLAALATGWQFKFVLITRAAYNQGFALPHLPVRGTR